MDKPYPDVSKKVWHFYVRLLVIEMALLSSHNFNPIYGWGIIFYIYIFSCTLHNVSDYFGFIFWWRPYLPSIISPFPLHVNCTFVSLIWFHVCNVIGSVALVSNIITPITVTIQGHKIEYEKKRQYENFYLRFYA